MGHSCRKKKTEKATIGGLYAIVNAKTGKRYVGASTDLKQRFRDHRSSLRNNRHKNKELQEDYNSLGIESFRYEVLGLYEEEFKELALKEEHYMRLLSPDMLYNSPGNQFTIWALKRGRAEGEL